ncbi:acyl carrier protein [Nitrospirillum sp. BR 11828]|uniref:acyl carrier protein n=1 Tax=Nitrospirillum sp. BR 11828 TaxID=3104325 RepID=UPI002ACA4055|nr:acyl carrier protein [Nitrospirillum sp. BR 11828]MDZ5649764.1 acyl carrier protein [Nitrospirillum sp. BR 11828]
MLKSDAVRTWIVGFLVSLLDVNESEIKGDTLFHVMGLDSVDAVVMAGALEEHFNVEIEAALFLRNSTIDGLIADLQANGIVE